MPDMTYDDLARQLECLRLDHDALLHELGEQVLRPLRLTWTAEEVQEWASKPNDAFGGQRPIDMLNTREGRDQLRQMIYQIRSGVAT